MPPDEPTVSVRCIAAAPCPTPAEALPLLQAEYDESYDCSAVDWEECWCTTEVTDAYCGPFDHPDADPGSCCYDVSVVFDEYCGP